MKKNLLKTGAALCAGVLLVQTAWAQPDVNNAPIGQNPPENNRQRNFGNMQDRRKQMEERMRQMLAHVGVNETTTQDAILAYVQADLEARRPLREQTGKLFQALNNGGVTDDQLLALVTDFRSAQEAEAARREVAQAELDAKIHYKQNPRLEAVLLLAGIVGDAQGGIMLMGGFGQNRFAGQNRMGDADRQDGQNQEMQQRREQMRQRLIQRFDKDGDGKLNDAEEAAVRQWRQERRQNRENRAPNREGNNPDNAPALPMQGAVPDADDE